MNYLSFSRYLLSTTTTIRFALSTSYPPPFLSNLTDRSQASRRKHDGQGPPSHGPNFAGKQRQGWAHTRNGHDVAWERIPSPRHRARTHTHTHTCCSGLTKARARSDTLENAKPSPGSWLAPYPRRRTRDEDLGMGLTDCLVVPTPEVSKTREEKTKREREAKKTSSRHSHGGAAQL